MSDIHKPSQTIPKGSLVGHSQAWSYSREEDRLNIICVCVFWKRMQDDHLHEKPGEVGEFQSCRGKVRKLGKVRENHKQGQTH